MKKRIFSIIALVLACAFTLSACDGCFSLPDLSFTNAFCGGSTSRENDPVSGYTETLTYDVRYAESSEGIAIDKSLKNNDKVKFEYSDGKYVSTLKVLSSFNEAETKLESDILDGLQDNEKQAYHLHTELSINVTFNLDGESYTHIDTIVSDSYFCKASLSFAPVYSKTTADYTNLYLGSKSIPVNVKTESEILYQKDSYTVNFNVNGEEPKKTDNDYRYKTVIDNAQLLFALRGFAVEEDSSLSLPVVAANYGEAVSLVINNNQKNTLTYETDSPLVVNYQDFVGEVEMTHLRFYKNNSKQTGRVQHVFIQNKVEDNSLAYRALPVKYVEPLSTYGSFTSMGALVYTLSNLTYNS